ncbi:MAG: PTS glucose transporter subunit IIBC [Kistimonas sp.]|nr:PTS glucose transporter subunit IIBC [Kistimonas sp.]
MSFFSNLFSGLQKIGKALMLPVSVLPAAGILLGVGSASLPWIPPLASSFMSLAGGAVFANLPIIFAIGVALGFSRNDGVAALAAVVGFVVMTASMGAMADALDLETSLVMGMESINTGVVGGILAGGMASWLFNRYYRIELPVWLGFFSGKRFVPICTAFASIFLGMLLVLIWSPVDQAINSFSRWAATGNPALAFSLYGLVERTLIPFGLHHIWNVPFFFEVGQYIDPETGKQFTGEIARYVAGDPTAGNMAGGYLFKMFGLPAAAIAIWHSARKENRQRTGAIMLSAALTSFLTGITEPIEFAFMFVAPVLYVVHAFLVGTAYYACIVLGIKHGMTFSHGFIDFTLLYGHSTRGWGVVALGLVYALVYYGLFRAIIAALDLKTPGRELQDSTEETAGPESDSMGAQLVTAFGGANNIQSLDACITRLRVGVSNPELADEKRLKQLGASGVVRVSNSIQAVFGTRSDNLKTDMEAWLNSGRRGPTAAPIVSAVAATSDSGKSHFTLATSDINEVLRLLGGKDNIKKTSACARTRIRVELKKACTMDKRAFARVGIQEVADCGSGIVHLLVSEDQLQGWTHALEAFRV